MIQLKITLQKRIGAPSETSDGKVQNMLWTCEG